MKEIKNPYQYRALPCPNFAQEDILMIQKYGFITHPYFIDNGFKTAGGFDWKGAMKNLKRFRPLFFIAKDDDWDKDLDIIYQHAANVIFPVHELRELKNDVNGFYGFPNNPQLRDYSINDFLDGTKGRKRWWLGVHDYPIKLPGYLLQFDGFDSTMPELYAGKYGKIWYSWRNYRKPSNRLHWRPIFEQNIQNFALFLDNLKESNPLDNYF